MIGSVLPAWRRPSFLYAIQFEDGRVKIGCTTGPAGRFKTIAREHGKIVSKHVEDAPHYMYGSERIALACASIVSDGVDGREFFRGLDFEDARKIVAHMAPIKFGAARYNGTAKETMEEAMRQMSALGLAKKKRAEAV